ncbi:MAG: TauD/TfdA family dioxygenase [Alphaproteobacteria bacterium]
MMNFTINPLSAVLGAEMLGADLAQPMDDTLFGDLHQAWLDAKGLLVFRDQNLTPEQHVAFSRRFGPLEKHVLAKYLLPGFPEIYRVSNKVENGEPQGREKAGTYWHSDLSYVRPAALASLLYGIEIPPVGGDTMFCSLHAAYDALSPRMQGILEGLNAVHDFGYASRGVFKGEKANQQQLDATPAVEHPVITTHPDTGNKALFVNPGFTSHIVDLHPAESRALLDYLFAHMTQPEFIYRHRWSVRDLVMWDNRCTMHYAVADYDAVGERYMHRTTAMCV